MVEITEKDISFGEDIIDIILNYCPCDKQQICMKVRAGLLDARRLNIHFEIKKSHGETTCYDGICPILGIEAAMKGNQLRSLMLSAANSVGSRSGDDQKIKFWAFSSSVVATVYLAGDRKIPELPAIDDNECKKYEESFEVFREAEELMEAINFQWYRRFCTSLVIKGVEDFTRYRILDFARIFLKKAFPDILEEYQDKLNRIDFFGTLFGNQNSITAGELTQEEIGSIKSYLQSQRGPP